MRMVHTNLVRINAASTLVSLVILVLESHVYHECGSEAQRVPDLPFTSSEEPLQKDGQKHIENTVKTHKKTRRARRTTIIMGKFCKKRKEKKRKKGKYPGERYFAGVQLIKLVVRISNIKEIQRHFICFFIVIE